MSKSAGLSLTVPSARLETAEGPKFMEASLGQAAATLSVVSFAVAAVKNRT